MPFFSVIVPVYNAEKYVARAIKSVLAQTFSDFELILVDDGSKDHSAEVVRQFTDPRVKLIQQENRGEGGARNTGIEHSSGNWLAFLDADDEWMPEFLEERYQLLKRDSTIEFCYSSYTNYSSISGYLFPEMKIEKFKDIVYIDNIFKSEFFLKYQPWIGTFTVSRSLLEQTGLFPIGLKIGTDIHLIMRACFLAKKIAFIPREHTRYYTDIGVMSQNGAEKKKQKQLSHYPATLLAIEEWEEAGKIPEQRQSSVRRFVEWYFVPWFIYQKGFDRAYGVAWKMLRRHVSPIRHPVCYAKAVLAFSYGWIRSFAVLRKIAKFILRRK